MFDFKEAVALWSHYRQGVGYQIFVDHLPHIILLLLDL